MKVNIKQELMGFDGKPIKDEKGNAITYRDVIFNILSVPDKNGEDKPEDKRLGYRLCMMIAGNDEVKFSTQEAAFIITKAEKYGTNLVLGRIEELFDSK